MSKSKTSGGNLRAVKNRLFRELERKAPKAILGSVDSECTDPFAFAVKMQGSSMAPTIADGDLVVFCPSRKARSGEPAFVKLSDGRLMIRRYRPSGRLIRLTADNPEVPEIVVSRNDIVKANPAHSVNGKAVAS